MACATISLKRTLDFDPLAHKRPKRRRCNPMALSSLHNTQPAVISKPPSVFQEATPSLSKEQLADSIKTEIRRLRKKKSSKAHHSAHISPSHSDSSDGEQLSTSSPVASGSSSQSISENKKDNVPLFTYKQMTILCERVMKERTEKLCEEYDKVLASKLAEQYEAFLKFNHDQIQRHFSNSGDASYLS